MKKYFWPIVVLVLIAIILRKMWIDEIRTAKRLPTLTPTVPNGFGNFNVTVGGQSPNRQAPVFEQLTPSALWIVPNFTGKEYPNVLVLDLNNEEITADVSHDPIKFRVLVLFENPQTGKVILS